MDRSNSGDWEVFEHTPVPSDSISGLSEGEWSPSASTFVDETRTTSSAPTGTQRRRSYRHSTPAFSFDIPEDPLHAVESESVALVGRPPRHEESTANDGVLAYSQLDFSRRQVSSIRPRSSTLSPRLTNPFTFVAPGRDARIKIKVYFPRAVQPTGQLLELPLPATATVEDAIALGLWTYWEKHWLPGLDASNPRDTAVDSWIMLVPGKDGVINRRIAQNKIASFQFDTFAIVRSPQNMSEKRQIEKQIARFKLSPPTPATTSSNNRHLRHRSLPVFTQPSRTPTGPSSLSKLP
ncbi:hypothetical protein C8R46DRAFT_333069 [Mycena filopes]|nr:hypothetical protein C8R46DRAFT_333069 [Mycena filopes]